MITCICTGKYKDGQVDGKKTCVSICGEEENNSVKKASRR